MALHSQSFGDELLMTCIPFLNVYTWKTFSITSKIFIKTLCLLWTKKVTKNKCFLTLYWNNNRKISILVYRKPTHTDQHLHYISHHLRSCKESVASSFFSRAYSFFINKYGFTKENARIKQMLKENGCQESVISKIFNRIANNLSFTQLQQQTRATISKRKRSERV